MNEEKPKGFYLSFRWKMIIIFTVLFTVVFGVAFYFIYRSVTASALEDMFSKLETVATNLAAKIDGDTIEALYNDADYDPNPELVWPGGMHDQRFWEIAQDLKFVFDIQGNTYPYTYTSPEEGLVEYIVSFGALLEPDNPGEAAPGATFKEQYFPQPPSVILEGMKEITRSVNPVTDEFGTWVSVFVPIKNSNGEIVAALGVDYFDTVVADLQKEIRSLVLPIMGGTYAVLFVAVYLVSSQMTAPIIKLTKVAETISEGVYDYAEERKGGTRDEVSTLTQVFNLMVEKVRAREEKLKKQVAQLQIVIDSQRQQEEVAQITETDFFQDLQSKAKKLRSREEPEDNGEE